MGLDRVLERQMEKKLDEVSGIQMERKLGWVMEQRLDYVMETTTALSAKLVSNDVTACRHGGRVTGWS